MIKNYAYCKTMQLRVISMIKLEMIKRHEFFYIACFAIWYRWELINLRFLVVFFLQNELSSCGMVKYEPIKITEVNNATEIVIKAIALIRLLPSCTDYQS